MSTESTPFGEGGSLQKVIQYAVSKEEEAAAFYTDLAGRVKAANVAAELRAIAAMEEGHKQKLLKMDVEAASRAAAPRGPDLKIVDYVVEKEPTPDMTWQELLTVAMHREQAAMSLYTDLAKIVPDPALRQLLENLATEESSHKRYFETVWDDEILIEN